MVILRQQQQQQQQGGGSSSGGSSSGGGGADVVDDALLCSALIDASLYNPAKSCTRCELHGLTMAAADLPVVCVVN
jgi:hypothetical protein